MRSYRRLTALLTLVIAAALATVTTPVRPLAQAAPAEACTASDDCSFYLSNSFRGGAADAAFAVGGSPNAVTVGDWDGDGTDTVGTRSGARFTLLASAETCAKTTVFAYGRAGDQVLVGDWDGDGVDTLAVRRGNTYYLRNSLAGGQADRVITYGRAGDQVLVGDWDGDGVDTLAVRRGTRWYLRNDLRSGVAQTTVTYGRAADTAIVGDWDGNGTDTPGVYRGARPAHACNASAIQKEWAARGGANGSLGAATSAETIINGISTQTFQNGRLSWTASSGVVATGTGGQAVGGARFDAAMIISDAEFFNSAAMDEPAIRSFLAEKNPSCRAADDGTACLKAYRANTSTMTSAYCSTYRGGSNEDVATVIAKAATACGINPRVLLVILQKEQGLVLATGNTLTAARYAKATGLYCSDTSPCDPTYAGLPSQIYYAASRLVQYGVQPTAFTYRAGQVTAVANNPSPGCGSQTVPILNRATAALYNYTPYVPNAAALNNMYGSGDSCSAYGNRNFWRYYRAWFGSTGV
ncbi:hypothetical protein SAMN05216355_101362 [Actinomyces ruminicola]|uniref:Repeat domain-containing protein n=1 Tax=Actinomyces ruminicola TaxID=332524 RepID=A0A1G9ZR13_9ACTO|nr:VCBS repeat-containing protein [Actinomyces ruminicola]SDN23809.1 hypothetical protein SAMN05216355_101362 [Actinomyces ruminicola]